MTALQVAPTGIVEQRIPRSGVIERLTQILDVFTVGPDHLLLEDVTTLTGLPRSTTFRLLSQLVELAWLEHDERGYRIGTRVHAIGSRSNDHSSVRAAASTALNDLHLATGGVAHLAVLDGSAVHYLDKIGGAASSSIPSRVGASLPAEATASGRALLATLSPERVDTLIELDLEGRQYRDLSAVHTQLNQVRRRHGLAFQTVAGEPTSISSVAAPILGPDGASGAIAVAWRGPVPFDGIAPQVAYAAQRTSRLLFPHWTRTTAAHRGRRRTT